MSFAIITISGNVGKDAEIRDVRDTTVATWSVAVSRGKGESPDWYRCDMWGIRGEKLAQYIRKGDRITVAGALSFREGHAQIRVHEVALNGSGGGGGGGRLPGPAPADRRDPGPANEGSPGTWWSRAEVGSTWSTDHQITTTEHLAAKWSQKTAPARISRRRSDMWHGPFAAQI